RRQDVAVALGVHELDDRVGGGGDGKGEDPERQFDPPLPGQVTAPGFFGTRVPGRWIHPRILGERAPWAGAIRPAGPTVRPRGRWIRHFTPPARARRRQAGRSFASRHPPCPAATTSTPCA